MPKPIIQDVIKQTKQISGEVIKEVVKQPGELAGKALEQLGITTAKTPTGQTQKAADQQKQLEEMKARDKQQTLQQTIQLKRELEAEVDKWRRIREEQWRQRQQQEEQQKKQEQERGIEAQGESLPQGTSKRKRGLFGSMGRQVKSALEQAAPETAGKRISG